MNISDIPRNEDGTINLDDIPLPDMNLRVKRLEEALELEILAELGQGTQGICFLIDDGRVFKNTDSEEEASLAAYLKENPHPLFPKIHDVYKMEDEFGHFFAIIREEIGDVFDDMDDESQNKENICRSLWDHLNKPYDLSKDTVFKIGMHKYPDDIKKLENILKSIDTYKNETDIKVLDMVFSNVGKNDNGELVIRDFGRNNIFDTRHGEKAAMSIKSIDDAKTLKL